MEIKTHVNVDPGEVEDFDVGVVSGRVSVELVGAPVPFERVQLHALEVVVTLKEHLFAVVGDFGRHLQPDVFQTKRAWKQDRKIVYRKILMRGILVRSQQLCPVQFLFLE